MPFLAPVVAAISAFAATAVGGFIVNAVVGIALSFASTLLAPKPKKPVGGTKLEVQYGADQAREIAVGLVAISGHDVYTNTYGKANKYCQKVFVLSDFITSGITRVSVNGKWHTIDWSDVEGGRGALVTGLDDDIIRVRYYDGRHTALQSIEFDDHGLVEESNPSGRWTAQHVGRMTSFVVVNYRYNDKDQPNLPTLIWEFKGAPVYDLRRDSTAGGSGSHRWDDVSTWEYSENGVLHAYAYERGFYVGGQLLIGKGLSEDDLPAARWMSAANVCDEPTSNRAKRYRCGALFNAGDGVTHRDNLEPVFQSFSGNMAELVDGDIPIVGANQPVVATIYDTDRIVGSAWDYQAKRSRTELVNSVYGTYNKPEDLWAATSYKPRESATALALDRERHAVALNFTTVDNEKQAAELAEAQLRRNRYQASETMTVRPRWATLEVGDWIKRDSEKYGVHTFQVVGISLGALTEANARNVTLTLDEVGTGIYDTSIVIPELPPRVGQAGPVYTLTPENFVVVASSVTAVSGRVYPAMEARWDSIDDVTVDAVLVQYWKSSDPDTVLEKNVQMPATYVVLVEGVLPNTEYTLRARVVTNPSRTTIWTDNWVVVTTDELIGMAELNAQLRSEIALITNNLDGSIQQYRDQLLQLIDAVAETNINHANFEMEQIDQIRTVVAEASDFASAAVLLEQTARIQGDQANAALLAALQATSGQATASGYMKLEAISDGVDGHARFAVYLNAGTPDNPAWARSGFVMEAWTQNGSPRSRVVFVTDQFAISGTGVSAFVPFFISNGNVYIDNAVIRDLDASNIKARSIDTDQLSVGGVKFENISAGAVSGSASGTGVDVELSLDVKAGSVQVLARCRTAPTGDQTATLRIYRDGVLLATEVESGGGTVDAGGGNGSRALTGSKPFGFILDAPSAGIHTYRASAQIGVSGDSLPCSLSLLNMRR